MSEQLAITLAAASVGFVSAVFFCVGNALNTSERILLQSTPFWDFNEPVARSLASQRAQYVVGALVLVAAFGLQVLATVASPTVPANLPRWLGGWPRLVLAIVVSSLLVAALCAWLLDGNIMRKVLRLEEARRQDDERLAESNVHDGHP